MRRPYRCWQSSSIRPLTAASKLIAKYERAQHIHVLKTQRHLTVAADP